MQTSTRKIRVILAEEFKTGHTDPTVIRCADRLYEEFTGKENPKRDLLGGWLGMEKEQQAAMNEVTEILHTFERELKRSDDLAGKESWRDFARGFVTKEAAKGHPYQTWLAWYRNDPKRMEWAWKETPESIKARWLIAFDTSTGREKSSERNTPAGV
jgi:hypothetical protein